MATENQQDILEDDAENLRPSDDENSRPSDTENSQPSDVENSQPSDAELFVDEVHEELLEREVFAGDEDFYKLLARQGRPQTAETPPQPAETPPPQTAKIPSRPAEKSGQSDSELFAGEVHEELLEREVFVGDEDFYKLLARQGQPQTAETPFQPAETPPQTAETPSQPAEAPPQTAETPSQPAEIPPQTAEIPSQPVETPPQTDEIPSQPVETYLGEIPEVPFRQGRFSTLQKVLAAGIAAVVVILLYTLMEPALKLVTKYRQPPADQQTPSTKQPVKDSAKIVSEQIQKKEYTLKSIQPLSLKVARDFFLQKDYEKAYAAYNQLRQSLPAGAETEFLRDFLQLKMALCVKKAGDTDQAVLLFRTLSQSRSPAVRTMANYYMAFIELQREQYLKARTRAYQTIALVEAVDFDEPWASSLLPDCYFLVAESMTRHILLLSDADKDLPGRLWSAPAKTDPFINLNEAKLRLLLDSGSEQLAESLLGPQIQKLEHKGTLPRWFVVCHGAAIEELLAKFTANVGLNIEWNFCKTPPSEGEEDAIRQRPASLYLPAATTQQFITVAAGHVGLLARLDQGGIVNIFNPADYSSLSENISLLSQEAVSLWQRYLSVFYSDKRIPNAHFALGLLLAHKDRITDAIAEYKLVANRYPQSSLAPFALLHSSKLRTNLRDYLGARKDLKQLVEQYSESELSGRACLYLADATMKAGLLHEAGRLYSKVYHLGLSLESQTASAFGAGRCFYEMEDYESAVKWLTRHINLATDKPGRSLYSACYLLGKSYLALGKTQQACDAFQTALGAPPGLLTKEEYIGTVSALVEAKIQQEKFVEALAILENIRSRRFSPKESIEISLLKSRILRAMGLVDEAVATLGDKAQYVLDPQLKARVSFELAKCCIAEGNLELARKDLAEILIRVEPGHLAHEVALKLADVCLKLGQSSQTISICSQLLDLGPSAPIKQKTLNILAAAYNQQKDYDKAALALLGEWNKAEDLNEKRTLDKSVSTDQSLLEAKKNPIEQDS